MSRRFRMDAVRCAFLFLICASQVLRTESASAIIKAQRQTYKHARVPLDVGVDTGIVKRTTALFVDPTVASAKIGTIRKGDLIVLVSRKQSNKWLNVIQFKSGHQGWIKSEGVIVHYTHHKAASLDFRVASMGTADSPDIKITNESNEGLYMHLGAMGEMYIAPRTTKAVTIPAGIYTYNVTAPNVLPLFGTRDFLAGSVYTWGFYITNVHQDTKRGTVSLSLVQENKKLQADVNKRVAEMKIEKQQIDADRDALEQRRSKWKSTSDEIEVKRQMLDHSDQVAIDDFNRLVDDSNIESALNQKAEQQLNAEVEAYNFNLHLMNVEQSRLEEIAKIVNAGH